MSEQTATAEGPGPAADEAEAGPIARYFGIDPASARRLAGSGYRTIERVGGLTPEELLKLGIPLEDIARIRSPPTPSDPPAPADPPKVPEDEDR
ncbi:MAG TPA: hypothetical protein VLY85_02870, partial [Thermoplasmata archaeon]|nr:hypothetical protein [Thermoplasmata archaeon]